MFGRGGGLLSTAGEFFLAQRLSRLFGVLNIAGAAVFPFIFGRNSRAKFESTFENNTVAISNP
jgi:hypothetical protein